MEDDFKVRVRELRKELHHVADNLDRVYREEEERRDRKRLAALMVGVLGVIAAPVTAGASLLIAGVVLAGGAVVTFIYEYIISKDSLRLVEMNWFRYRDIWAENLGAAGRMGGRPVTKEDLKLYDEILNSRNPMLNILLLGVTIETVIRMSLGHPGDLVRRLERDLDKLPRSVSEIRDEDIIPEVRRQMKFDLEKIRRELEQRRREEEERRRKEEERGSEEEERRREEEQRRREEEECRRKEEERRRKEVEILVSMPVFSAGWHERGEYTYEGGKLQCPQSAVTLTIPRYSIPRPGKVTVQAVVSTDIVGVHDELHLEDDETIITPVPEFYAGENFTFHKPVMIELPCFLPPECPESDITVYQFYRNERGLQKQRLSEWRLQPRQSGVFSFRSETMIQVLTSHFSGVFACRNCGRDKRPDYLHIRLYGQHVQQDTTRKVDLWLYLWDGRLSVVDFRKDVIPREVDNEVLFRAHQRLAPPADVSDVEVKARLKLDETDRLQWNHTYGSPSETAVELENLVTCSFCARDRVRSYAVPQNVTWLLENKPDLQPSDYFSCDVHVGYVKQGRPVSKPQEQILTVVRLPVTKDLRGTDSAETARSSSSEEEGATGGEGTVSARNVGNMYVNFSPDAEGNVNNEQTRLAFARSAGNTSNSTRPRRGDNSARSSAEQRELPTPQQCSQDFDPTTED